MPNWPRRTPAFDHLSVQVDEKETRGGDVQGHLVFRTIRIEVYRIASVLPPRIDESVSLWSHPFG